VKDYVNYAKVDWSNQASVKNVRGVIEDTLIRLEEFQSIVAMVENSSAECMQQHLPKLQQMKDGMATLRNRIDALEHIVAMANMNLSTLEAAVDKAEADLGVSDRLFGILNPLSFFQLELPVRFSVLIVRPPWTRIYLERCIYLSTCEEATEVETHHQQTAATTMGVAEDETPSSLTSSHPNTNNPNQEEWSKLVLASSSQIQTGPLSYVTSKGTFPQLAIVNVLKSKRIVWKFKSRIGDVSYMRQNALYNDHCSRDFRRKNQRTTRGCAHVYIFPRIFFFTAARKPYRDHNEVLVLAMYGLLTYFPELVVLRSPLDSKKIRERRTCRPADLASSNRRTASCSVACRQTEQDDRKE
ncbi:Protein cappuccino like protein, partial [Trachymyrmex cornetzi]